jgi:L-cystine uptake protein TcyP (sodium:dicarboxylate symporter family)
MVVVLSVPTIAKTVQWITEKANKYCVIFVLMAMWPLVRLSVVRVVSELPANHAQPTVLHVFNHLLTATPVEMVKDY